MKSFDLEIQKKTLTTRMAMIMHGLWTSDELVLLKALSTICYVLSGYN